MVSFVQYCPENCEASLPEQIKVINFSHNFTTYFQILGRLLIKVATPVKLELAISIVTSLFLEQSEGQGHVLY